MGQVLGLVPWWVALVLCGVFVGASAAPGRCCVCWEGGLLGGGLCLGRVPSRIWWADAHGVEPDVRDAVSTRWASRLSSALGFRASDGTFCTSRT